MPSNLPISHEDVVAARSRIAPYLAPTPLREYEQLSELVGFDIEVRVKHENHQPTNAFKIRNALSALTGLAPAERAAGVITATRGNHGQGVALAARRLGIPATVCVPLGNNPEKNAAIRGFGAQLIERGRDYDETLAIALSLAAERGLRMVHSTNDPAIVAGAGTITLEILEQWPAVDTLVLAIGGGSLAVGAMAAARRTHPDLAIFGVQADGASAIYEGWRAGRLMTKERADTFADGLATRACYELTFGALCTGLRDFVTVSDAEIAEALRLMLRTTHNLAEGAGAAGLAGLWRLREGLRGRKVAIVLSGSNIDEATLRRVINREI